KDEFEIEPIGVGPPRFDPYQRLLARFYEPLFLLRALGQTRGGHTPRPLSLNALMERRRRFLQNLAYVCDFEKGGDSCTAIGLESRQSCYLFWVASNSMIEKIVSFLNTALNILMSANSQPVSDLAATESAFIQLCVDFATSRIDLERKNLEREAKNCILSLTETTSKTAQQLVKWLRMIIDLSDNIELCHLAYKSRNSVYIDQITEMGLQEENELDPAGRRSCFCLTRHHFLALAHHIRAPKKLFDDSLHLGHILQTYEVCGIDPFPSVPGPVRDSHTNLRGVLNRMYKTPGEEKDSVREGLLYLNRISSSRIFDSFVEQYDHDYPQVHAEVQVLEHFHQKRLSFAHNDRFVACSKPACLCCELYFKHHPARMVLPPSHRKVWTRWSPPAVKAFNKGDAATREQIQIMSKITQDLRDQIIDQVLQRSQASRWHADSITYITETVSGGRIKLLDEQHISENSCGKSVANSSNSPETGEQGGLDQELDSDDGGVSIDL
ncbi:unnamed protein product, partial [Penicillium salamii]